MNELPNQLQNAATVRWLKNLVVVLSCTFIAGFIVVCGLFVINFIDFDWSAPAPPLPPDITLPPGVNATAVTWGTDWYAVVADSGEILVFDAGTGRLAQRIRIGE